MTTTTNLNELIGAYANQRHDMEWKDQASCAEYPPDTFFPEDATGMRTAKKICTSCPVQAECLRDVLKIDGPVHGIWGGYGVSARNKLKKTLEGQTVQEVREWLTTETNSTGAVSK